MGLIIFVLERVDWEVRDDCMDDNTWGVEAGGGDVDSAVKLGNDWKLELKHSMYPPSVVEGMTGKLEKAGCTLRGVEGDCTEGVGLVMVELMFAMMEEGSGMVGERLDSKGDWEVLLGIVRGVDWM